MKNVKLTPSELAGMIDNTLLKADSPKQSFEKLCRDSAQYKFKIVAVNGAAVDRCVKLLDGTGVLVGAAIGFPLGQTTTEAKVFEANDAIVRGAKEIDYVVNLVELKSGNISFIEDEMKRITACCRENNVTVKVIFENCYLTQDEKKILCAVARKVKPDFVKTSTGFGTGGATEEDVRLMKSLVGDDISVKASGGIRDMKAALAMIEAGARRIGTSAGVKIVEEYKTFSAGNFKI